LLTDNFLFGDIWRRAELSPRDRSLITVAALIAGGNTEQLRGHLTRARENGLTETELKEIIIHPCVLRRLAEGRCRRSGLPSSYSTAETPFTGITPTTAAATTTP
jgi:Carboxymuconolactone decarboxylase family